MSGRDLSGIDYYIAFAYWKLACILEGVYARYLGGALGELDPSQFDDFRVQVDERVGAGGRADGATAMTDAYELHAGA